MSKKSRQHPDFPGGHPPEYYPSLKLLNFTERTGYGVLSLRWPSTTTHTTAILPYHTLHFDTQHQLKQELTIQHTPTPSCRRTSHDDTPTSNRALLLKSKSRNKNTLQYYSVHRITTTIHCHSILPSDTVKSSPPHVVVMCVRVVVRSIKTKK